MNRKKNQREENGMRQATPLLPLEEYEAARAKQETVPRQEADKRLHEDARASRRASQTALPGVQSTAYSADDPLRMVRANAAQLAGGAWKSAREAEAAVWMAGQGDAVMRSAAYAQLDRRYDTPGDSLYAPYRHATNQALMDNMAALGYDVSGGVNDDFFARNADLMQAYRTSASGVTNTPQAPTKSSTDAENAAYYYYQLLKDEETTKAAESEWAQMQREARYWTRKGLSDEEVIAKVNGQPGKYRTLRTMDENAARGTPTPLNRPVDYSQDNLYGVIWAERNGDDSGDYRASAVRAALGQGVGYARDIGREKARNPASDAYHPYRYGGTGLDDAALYFGVDGFEDAEAWLNENAGLLAGGDEQAARYYKQVYAAHQNTQEARAELDALYTWAKARLDEGAGVDEVKRLFDLRWEEKALDDETLSLSVLRAMDKGREIGGTPVALTGAVNYRREDFLRWLDSQGGGRVPRRALASAAQGTSEALAQASEGVSSAEAAAPEPPPSAEAQALIDQRAEYIDSYNGLLRAAQTNPLSVNREIMAETRDAIDRLTAQIGDGYVAKAPYTMAQAHNVLTRALAGQRLTEEEKRVFDSFYADNPYLFPYGSFSHDEGSGDFLQTDAAQYVYGKTAQEALTYADSADATPAEAADTMARIAQDALSAQAADMSLDDWYAQNPAAEAELLSVRDAVLARRAAAEQAQAEQAEARRAAQLEYSVNIMARVAQGEALTEEERGYYQTAILGQDEKAIMAHDQGYAERYTQVCASAVDGTMAADMGLTEENVFAVNDYVSLVNGYLLTDAKLAASCGMTLDEMYALYPAMEKTKETLYERARQDYEAKWAVGDPAADPAEADAAAGLGFFRTLGLGVSSGAKGWWAGKVGFAAMASDTGEAYTSSANYQAYTGEYGLADARYYYRQDVTAAIAAMDDSDPNKATYQAMLEEDRDIFSLPFNFTYEALNQERRRINAEIQANADLVRELGTAMENTVYNVSASVTQNSLLMGEAALVNAVVPVSGAVGVAAAYGTAEWQGTYFDARSRGASRTQAQVLGLLHAGVTTALEGVMYDRYLGQGADRVIGKLTGPVNRALGTMAENAAQSGGKRFLARAGQLGVALVENAAGEGVQENVESMAAGAIDALAYQDPEAFLQTLRPATVKDTFLNAMVTALFLSGEGQLIQAGGKALSPKPDAAVKYLDYAAETALLDPELRQELTEARSAWIVQERIGQGALSTPELARMEGDAVDAESFRKALEAKLDKASAQEAKLTASYDALAAGMNGMSDKSRQLAEQLGRMAADQMQVRAALEAQLAEQQGKAQAAREALDAARRSAYLALQQSSRAMAQQEVSQQAEAIGQALLEEETRKADERFHLADDAAREAALRETKLAVAPDDASGNLSPSEVERLENSTKRDARRYVGELLQKFGVLKRYTNLDAQIEFDFTKGGADESIHQQSYRGRSMGDFARMLSQMDSIVENAVAIETHTDKYAGTTREDKDLNQTYVLLSGYKKGENIVPVQLEVKTFKKNSNRLYMAVTLNEIEAAGLRASRVSENSHHPTAASTISITEQDGNVNLAANEIEAAGLGGGLPSASQQRTTNPTAAPEATGLGPAQPFRSDEQRSDKTTAASTISIADLIAAVNPADGDFLKYVPDGLLSEAQREGKRQALSKERARIAGMRPPAGTDAGQSTGLSGGGGSGLVPPGGAGTIIPATGEPTGPQRQFGHQTAQRSEAIDQATRDWLYQHSGYIADTNRAEIDRAIAAIEAIGEDQARSEWLAKADSAMGNKDDQAMGVTLMGLAAHRGDVNTEVIIADKYNRIGTVLGQGLQARKIFNMMTPLGAQAYVNRVVHQVAQDYGKRGKRGKAATLDITVREETLRRIGEAATLIERQDAVDAAMREIAQQIPPTVGDRLNSWRYLAMLGNPRTHIRNLMGNAVFAPAVAIRNKVSAAIQAVAKEAGWIQESTRALPPLTDKAYRDFAAEDLKNPELLRRLEEGEKYTTDRKIRGNLMEKYRRSWGDSRFGRSMQRMADFNKGVLSKEDMIFKKGYYKHALASYLQTNHIDLKTASDETLNYARSYSIHEAQVNTYNNFNSLVAWLSRKLDEPITLWDGRKVTNYVGKGASIVLEGAYPFKSAPANILARGVEYSPVGLAATITVGTFKLKKGELKANEYIDQISSGLTGTGAFLLGMLLRSAGLISGSMGDDDEDKFAKLTGEQEYAMKVYDGDGNAYSYTLDWLTPGGLSIFIGADFYDMMQEGGVSMSNLFESMKSLAEPAFNLTMLDGLNNLFGEEDATNAATKAITGYLGQFVPTLFGQIARTIDPVRRSNYVDKNSPLPADAQYFLNKQMNKLPFLSQLSTPYVDAWGEQDVSDNFFLRAFENFFSAGYINRVTVSDTTEMLERVAQESGETGVYPTASARYITVKGQRHDLSAEEWTRYQTRAGQSTKTIMAYLTGDPAFAGLEPAYQAEALREGMQWSSKMAQAELVDGVSMQKWMQKAATPEEAARAVVERARKSQTDDYSAANAQEITRYAAQGDLEACQNLMGIFWGLELTEKEARSALSGEARERYMEAWKAGDYDVCMQMEDVLGALVIGLGKKEFNQWKAAAEKE